MWIRAALADVAARLESAGIPAAVDPRELAVPGAWVTVGPIGFDRLDGDTRTLQAVVYLLTRDTGTPDALDYLAEMIDAAAGILPVGDVTPQTLALPNQSGDPLPAAVFTVDLEITPEPAPAPDPEPLEGT